MHRWLRPAFVAIAVIMGAVTADAAGPAYKVHVAGLACPFCAYGVEKSLGAIEGVKHVETNIKDGVVVVAMAEGQTLDRAMAEKAVENAGFTLVDFEAVAGEQ